MKVLFLTNNPAITGSLSRWLYEKAKEEIVIWEGKVTTKMIQKYSPDFIISYNYRYKINHRIIHLFPNKIINLHISYLPWNKGAHPNIWSFLENTPKGVTIHFIDENIDTGDIIVQKTVEFNEENETLTSSYQKLHKEIQKLFKEQWNNIKQGKWLIKPNEKGTFHYSKDFEQVQEQLLGNEGWDISIRELRNRYTQNLGR